MADKDDSLKVLGSFTGHDGKRERVFLVGELVRANDPAVKKWPHLFGPADYRHDAPHVEQATAAPGEKRA